MSYSLAVAADFGPANTGLTGTVGYQLYNASNGAATGSRITAGIAESPAGSGVYVAAATIPAAFAGTIAWDTGEATPVYAVDTIDGTKEAAAAVDTLTKASGPGDLAAVKNKTDLITAGGSGGAGSSVGFVKS